MTELIQKNFPTLRCVHEPRFSLILFLLANANHSGYVPKSIGHRLFQRRVRLQIERARDCTAYVEFNALAHDYAPIIRDTAVTNTVVHLVRDPRTWIRSLLNFRASGWRRHVIDHVPLSYPRPVDPKVNWPGLTEIERAAWRWRLVNESIESSCTGGTRFVRFLYEDLFPARGGQMGDTLWPLLETLGVETRELVPRCGRPRNIGRLRRVGEWRTWSASTREAVLKICGPMMQAAGYAPEEG